MDFFGKPGNLKLLQDLLKEPEENSSDSEPDDRLPNFKTKFSTSTLESTDGENSVMDSNQQNSSSNIQNSHRQFKYLGDKQPQTFSEWEEQETKLNDELDDRVTPEYRIVYKQSVAPEDIYLQMGNKTPATSSCEEMCLEILMPNETVCIDRMELDVSTHEIDLKTPYYRLKLPLVQPTDPDRGKAQWDDKKKILHLTLRMKREYDFINF